MRRHNGQHIIFVGLLRLLVISICELSHFAVSKSCTATRSLFLRLVGVRLLSNLSKTFKHCVLVSLPTTATAS